MPPQQQALFVSGNRMKSLIAISVLVCVLCSCSSPKQEKVEKFPKDDKLINSWKLFKAALNKSDLKTLQSLSNDCINSLAADTVVTKEEFYNKYFNDVFSDKLLAFINDTTKVSGGYDGSNVLEMYPCLSANTGLTSPKLASIYIEIPIANQREGLSVILDFIETNTDYKFCGHYTIP
mgnify:CR=1 FL=1